MMKRGGLGTCRASGVLRRALRSGQEPNMSKDFPGPPDSHGEPTWITYYTATEAARFLHVSPVTFRLNCRNGRWPHLRWQRGYFVNAAQMDRIRELSTLDIDAIPKWEPDGRIGEVRMPWDDEEGVQ